MTERTPWAAGLALAGGILVLLRTLLVPVAYGSPEVLVGVEAEALRDRYTALHGPALFRILLFAAGLAAAGMSIAGGTRMARPGPAGPLAGLLAVAGGLLALPFVAPTFLGAQASVLGGALHWARHRSEAADADGGPAG